MGSRSTVPRITPYTRPTGMLNSTTRLQAWPARNSSASPSEPSSTSRVRGSPKCHQATAGSIAQARMPTASLGPRRSSTRQLAAALNQNNSGTAAEPTTTRVACMRPRMMNSARARMRFIPYYEFDCLLLLTSVAVGVRQQGQVAGALDSDGQLTLVLGLGTGDTAGNDLAGFGDVGLQGVEILEVDLFHAFGGETAEFTTTEETCHEIGSSIDPWITRQRCRCCHRLRLRRIRFQRAHGARGAR